MQLGLGGDVIPLLQLVQGLVGDQENLIITAQNKKTKIPCLSFHFLCKIWSLVPSEEFLHKFFKFMK